MLLLMAIHFHSNQLPAICELVCATLGMKVPLRPNNMTRLKQIFTQDIFTEQVLKYYQFPRIYLFFSFHLSVGILSSR